MPFYTNFKRRMKIVPNIYPKKGLRSLAGAVIFVVYYGSIIYTGHEIEMCLRRGAKRMAQGIAQESTIAKTIRAAARQGKMSHALLLSGSGDLIAAARYAAAAMLCRSEAEKPCMRCVACHKVMADIHPDVRLVCDAERRELSVESVRELRRDVYIRPNEGERKIYIFTRCDQLNERDQNVLLKIVEEGPPYAAFIFCASGASQLLPTVRSRCVAWQMNEAEETAEDPLSTELCRRLAAGDPTELTAFTVSLETRRVKREQLREMFRCAWRTAAEALLMQCGKTGADGSGAACAALLSRRLPRRVLQKLTELLRYYAGECEYNVGAGHVLGGFTAECEELLRKMQYTERNDDRL